MKAIDSVPVWEEEDGSHSYGLEPREDHPPVVGWSNILTMEIYGEEHQLVAVEYEDEH